MEHYIVRYTLKEPPTGEREQVKSFPGVQIINEAPRMFLVTASVATAAALQSALPHWTVSAEQTYAVPVPPRPQIV